MRSFILLFLFMPFLQMMAKSIITVPAYRYPNITKDVVVQKGRSIVLNPVSDLGAKTSKSGGLVGLVQSTSYTLSDTQAFSVSEKDKTTSYISQNHGWGHYSIYTLTAQKAGSFTFTGKVSYVDDDTTVSGMSLISFGTSTVTYNITVIDVTSVSIPSTLSLKVGDYTTIDPVITDSRATTTFTWTSDNTSVATISDGVVVAQSAGTAHIKCTAANGVSATCTVTVSSVPVSQIVLPSTAVELTEGSTYRLTPTIIPSNATNQEMTWTTSNSSVATVNKALALRPTLHYDLVLPAGSTEQTSNTQVSTASIYAIAPGTATITGYAMDGSGKSVSCRVTVTPQQVETVPVENIELSGNQYQCMYVGETYQLTANVLPSNATDKSVIWSCEDNSVVTVSSTGLVTTVGLGSTTVKCIASDGSGVTATCVFDVIAKKVNEIALSTTAFTIEAGRSQQLTATILPLDATDKTVIWGSSDESVAQVSTSGMVTALSPGASTIVCRAMDGSGVVGKCIVTVMPVAVRSITLNTSSCNLNGGETFQLSANILPSNAANKTLLWSSSDFSVASVDENGLITAVGNGEAAVTCSAMDGSGISAVCYVTVSSIPVSAITLNQTSCYTDYRNIVQLRATVSPTNASVTNVVWTSSNNNIATVDDNGLVTAQGKGKVTITCTACDNSGVSATCEVTVSCVYPLSFSIAEASGTMDKGDKQQLNAVVIPANTTYSSIGWKSSNTSVATVDANGLVTAVGVGEATITCTLYMMDSQYFMDPDPKTATFKITVISNVTAIATIPFVDNEVKRICVENWDTDGDGELSYDEAASVTDLGTVFQSNKTVSDFRELQYFSGLKTIGRYAFSQCRNLSKVILPDNLETLDDGAFWGCRQLATIEIPAKVSSIGLSALSGCPDRTSLKVVSGNSKYDSRNDCNAIIETATNTLIFGCTTTVVPQDIVAIRSGAFHECRGLQTVVIGKNVTDIERGAFLDCADLQTIIVDASNSVYDSRNNCNAIICSATNELLVGCKNTIIPDDIVAISPQAFRCQSDLEFIFIPSSVKTIGWQAFNCAGLTQVELPEGLSSIGNNAFSSCINLTRVELPSTLTEIGNEAFDYCNNLHIVVSRASSPIAVTNTTFPACINDAVLYVPMGSKAVYEAADYWKEFKEIVEMESEEVMPTDISSLTDAIYANAVTGLRGSSAMLTISLKNAQTTNGYSFDLKLPEGVTLAKDNNDEFVYTLSNRHNGHVATVNYRDALGVYSFAVMSLSSKDVKESDGAIMTLALNISDEMAEGDYAVKVQNAKYSLSSGATSVAMENVTSLLTIESYIKGDANGDSFVDIADAVCIVNHIVGKATPAFIEAAADANGDGVVDIADAVRIVNLIVGKIDALARKQDIDDALPEPE